jgi:hypothetical protein
LEDGAAFLNRLVCAHNQGKGAKHEHHRAPSGGFRQHIGGAARTEGRLTAGPAKSACKVSGFAALQQHDDDENKTIQHKKRLENKRAAPREAEAERDDPESDEQRDGPFHPTWHFYLLVAIPRLAVINRSNLRSQFVRGLLAGTFDDGRE